MDGQLAEQFVTETLRRYDTLLFDGVDIAPGEPWSMQFEAPLFLNALQKMDDTNAKHNLRYWSFLHVGGSLPN